jgi:hypothetical protein
MNVRELRQIIKEEVTKALKEVKLDPENQKLKNKYIDAYVTLTIDPYAFDDAYDGSDDFYFPDMEEIEAHAEKYGYEDTLRTIDKMEDVRSLRDKFSQPSNQEDPLKAKTPGTWVDNLSMRDPLMHLTKSGKMNKLDIDRLKLRIKKNLGLI